MGRMTLAEILAQNLKVIRGELTQDDFARKLGISRSTLAQIEAASAETTIDTLEQIAKALHCHVEGLLRTKDGR